LDKYLKSEQFNLLNLIESFNYIEGDYLETNEGLFFSVKGMYHPKNRVISILRYIPNPHGNRQKNGLRYKRVYEPDETSEYLEKNHPEYLSYVKKLGIVVQSVPIEKIKKVYNPREKFNEIRNFPRDKPAKILKKFVEAIIEESGVSSKCFGVTGSILVGLNNPDSDIDLNVYGFVEGKKVYQALKKLREKSLWIKGYDENTVIDVLKSRWSSTGLDIELFKDIEIKKILHGIVEDRDYFIRLIKPFKIEKKSKPLRIITIVSKILKDGESTFTPCRYILENITEDSVSELVSYRGKFTEQVRSGEFIEARGMLEKVWYTDKIIYRLMLGRKGDYLLPAHFFEK
jgi:predicted nucleotidyltransferase